MKKIVLTLLLSVFCLCGLKAQSYVLKIQMNDETETLWKAEMISNIYFDNDSTLIVVENGNSYTHSYNILDVNKMYFQSEEGLNEINFEHTSFVYPNPAKDFVKLSAISCQLSAIKVYNCLGMIVEEIEVNADEIELNLSDYKSGVYFIHIKGKEINKTEKIVVL